MGLYQNDSGVLTPIAGRGKMGFGISHYKSGRANFPNISANSYATVQVTFDEPMPDSNYIVNIQGISNAWLYYDVWNITPEGFLLYLIDGHGTTINAPYADWYAFKPYTDVEYDNTLLLSRPDLWTPETEYSFGNNLYGMRKAGTISFAANTQYNEVIVPASVGLTTNCAFINKGGWWEAGGAGGFRYFVDANWRATTESCYWYDPTANNIKLAFFCSAAKSNVKYDTWITYKK